MRRVFVFFVFVISYIGYIWGLAHAAELTVATFNTEFMSTKKVHVKFGEDFTLDDDRKKVWGTPGFRNDKFVEAADHVAEAIAAIDADVITLTEIGNDDDLTALWEAVKKAGVDYPYKAICKCNSKRTGQHVAVLSKFVLTDILPQIPGRAVYRTELDDPAEEKWASVSKGLKVKFSAHGHVFHLYVVHFISERRGYDSDQKRLAQASLVRRDFLPLINASENVIVTGDLNDARGHPPLDRIRGFDDIFPDLIQTGLVKYFDSEDKGTRWTYEYQGERNQIDHILLSDNIDAITRSRKGIKSYVFDPKDPLASDHRAFVVTLNLLPVE